MHPPLVHSSHVPHVQDLGLAGCCARRFRVHHAPPSPMYPMCRISGLPGVALDDLVYIMTRLARQAEDEGFDKMFAAAEEATRVMKVRGRRSKSCLQG